MAGVAAAGWAAAGEMSSDGWRRRRPMRAAAGELSSDAEAALLGLRELQGVVYAKGGAGGGKNFLNCKADMSDLGSEWQELMGDKKGRREGKIRFTTE